MARNADIPKRIFDVVPQVMRAIRSELRTVAKTELTIPQLRVLANLFQGVDDATTLAEQLGVSLPAISKMIDGLSERRLVARRFRKQDRRQARVVLTKSGRALFLRSRRTAQARFAARIAKLDERSRRALQEGLDVLGELFSTPNTRLEQSKGVKT